MKLPLKKQPKAKEIPKFPDPNTAGTPLQQPAQIPPVSTPVQQMPQQPVVQQPSPAPAPIQPQLQQPEQPQQPEQIENTQQLAKELANTIETPEEYAEFMFYFNEELKTKIDVRILNDLYHRLELVNHLKAVGLIK